MFDIEVIFVMEHSDQVAIALGVRGLGVPIRRDGDGGEVNLLRHGECTAGKGLRLAGRVTARENAT